MERIGWKEYVRSAGKTHIFVVVVRKRKKSNLEQESRQFYFFSQVYRSFCSFECTKGLHSISLIFQCKTLDINQKMLLFRESAPKSFIMLAILTCFFFFGFAQTLKKNIYTIEQLKVQLNVRIELRSTGSIFSIIL